MSTQLRRSYIEITQKSPANAASSCSRGASWLHHSYNETIHRPTRPHHSKRCAEKRSHRHGHSLRVRLSNAVQSRQRIPIAHHKEATFQKHCLRVAVVHSRRHEYQLPKRARRAHLGRMGGRVRKARRNLRLSVAQVADRKRRTHRPTRPRCERNQDEPRQSSSRCQRVECRSARPYGAPSVPPPFSVLRIGRPSLVATLPAKCRRVPRLAFQYRLLRAPHAHGGAGLRSRSRRSRRFSRRRASLRRPHRAGELTAPPHTAFPSHVATQPRSARPLCLSIRGHHTRRLQSPPTHQGESLSLAYASQKRSNTQYDVHIMLKLLEQTRRPDITFSRNGRISITARIARILSLSPGDCINIAFHQGECYLFASRTDHSIGRHIAKCYPTKKGFNNYCANSVTLCRLMLDRCGVSNQQASFMVGREEKKEGEVYLPIIYKKPL